MVTSSRRQLVGEVRLYTNVYDIYGCSASLLTVHSPFVNTVQSRLSELMWWEGVQIIEKYKTSNVYIQSIAKLL